MKKVFKILCVVLAFVMCATMFASCTKNPANEEQSTGDNSAAAPSDLKIGIILVGDENEGYTYAHIKGIQDAAKKLNIADDQIIWKYSVKEDETCYDAAADLADNGCTLIISNSYGHESHMKKAASEFTDVTFVSMTGDQAAASGLSNFKNAFTNIYEARYVSGVVAGMKVAELVKEGKLTDANYEDGKVKIGYVGAYPYAEVVSGYTAFFLGVQSVYKDVTMEVQYTNSWFNITAEGEAAKTLMADGCVIISQHADSTGAPAAVEAAYKNGTTAYSVGYNIDMRSVAPDVALTSATNNWEVYYEYAFKTFMDGGEIATNWSEGYKTGAVAITELGDACAEGTAEKVESVINSIKDGSLKVFDTSTWTVGGETLTSYTNTYGFEGNELISDGYFHESELRSAPAFDIRIDGIKELNAEG